MITAREFGQRLIEQDPAGTLPLQVVIIDKADPDADPLFLSEPTKYDIELTIKHATQTDDGDRDVVRCSLRLWPNG